QFPDYLSESQQTEDALATLGELAKTPAANIIKLPNISASIPQLTAAIDELQKAGFPIPDFPADPQSEEEKEIRARYTRVLGSAVNPVLREGNSDRRVAGAVKNYAQAHPHSMGEWSADTNARVMHMNDGDFYGSERSTIFERAGELKITLETADGQTTVLRDSVSIDAGEVVDVAVMQVEKLSAFFADAVHAAKEENMLLSLHLKATMMKVSDPIIFGHMVKVFYRQLFDTHSDALDEIGFNPNNGIGALESKLEDAPADVAAALRQAIQSAYNDGPGLAMVDSDRGITNLHVPSDVIIDASMPAAIRSGGQMWNADGNLQPTLAVIPDRSYAGVYQETITFCKTNGAFDVSSMGNVANVGLMAKKAQEYGSHDKTFEIPADGTVQVTDSAGNLAFEIPVSAGDLFRMCQTKDVAIRDWVRLAVHRCVQAETPAVFWLDENRAHDANLISLVKRYLDEDHEVDGLDIQIMAPPAATQHTCRRIADGKDCIAATGNVLRDYLTDLFPILELGTSAKMLSIVPLLAGGGLFETGAGGSAPKHVQQFVEEGHLRWDSLGEFLALAVSLEDLGSKSNNPAASLLAKTLDAATETFLNNDKSPKRGVGELDTRGSHFFLALYWAQELAKQQDDPALATRFAALADALGNSQQQILDELLAAQGAAISLSGYYRPDVDLVSAAMRPSQTLNAAIDAL
ncbi:MAG: NADP-dependent isocitrate dehydrogenase, partial [Planctomycetota bacterium]